MTKEEILSELRNRNVIAVDFHALRFTFGFKRVDGLALAFVKVIMPSKTEEDMSYMPENDIHNSIKLWCIEQKIFYQYNREQNQYLFSL